MTRPSFSKRGPHSESSPVHPIDAAWWRQQADRRHRLPPRKGAGCRWSCIRFGGRSLVIFDYFGLGAWQVGLTASVGGPGEVASLNDGDGRQARPPGRMLRFVPSDLMRRLEQQRGVLDRLRSERRSGLRPPRLALVNEKLHEMGTLHVGEVDQESNTQQLVEFAKASMTDNMHKLQVKRSSTKKKINDPEDLDRKTSENDTMSSNNASRISSLEAELKDMKERYLHMSLQYAQVEAQREELVLKLKSMQKEKR